MCKWFFMALLVCVVTSEKKLLTFHAQEKILTNCIKHYLESFDARYKSTPIVSVLAYLSGRRFHEKSMISDVFNDKFKQFSYYLRSHSLKHGIGKDQLPKELQLALKQALIICAEKKLLSDDSVTQSDELISFSHNKNWLFECIKTHLRLTGHREFQLEDGFTEVVAGFSARSYFGKSMLRRKFYKKIYKVIHNLPGKKIYNDVSIDILSDKLELSITQAVEDCAMGKIPLGPVPAFAIEPSETAKLLNLILVKWPHYLRLMIDTRNGRAILRMYASDAWTALLNELNVYQNDTQIFRLALRSFWNNRAREMYDANSVELPYIVHRYTLNYPVPHVFLLDSDKFINRKNQNFSDRNPVVPRSYLDQILNIHTINRPYSEGEEDIFDYYTNNGMTSADYYFEYQLNQFYRILFFFLELRAREIYTDDDDVFDGPLPKNLVPEQIQGIIYDDNVYRDYLLDERNFYEMLIDNNTQNEAAQSLFESARVLEENLVLLRSNIPSTSGIRSSFHTATTMRPTIITTTQSLKRKDEVWKNKYGKCFPKRAKTAFIPNSNDTIHNLHTENLNQLTYLPFQEIPKHIKMCFDDDTSQEQDKIEVNNFYGYLMLNDNKL